MRWRKAIFNCVINPTTSLLACEVGGIVNPQLDSLKRQIIDECVAVARADDEALLKAIEACGVDIVRADPAPEHYRDVAHLYRALSRAPSALQPKQVS